MSILDFLSSHMEDLQQIITELDDEFGSHDFLERFARRFETEYITFLSEHRKPVGQRGSFKEVHGQIARFLSKNQTALNIEKIDRQETKNVFGNATDNQMWRKV